jgi:hypothetical protein
MNTKMIFLLAVIGSMGIFGITATQTQTTSAEDQTCEFTDTNQECNFKIKKFNVEDDFNLKIINGQAGGSGGGGTVDSQARADIATLQQKDVEQDNALTVATQNQSDTDSAQDQKIAQLESVVQNLTGNIIGDISLENGTVVLPPGGNDTGTGGGNGNDTGTGGGGDEIPDTSGNNTGFPPTNDTGNGEGEE